MYRVQLVTDSGCDLSPGVLERAGIESIAFPFTLDGEERFDDFGVSLSHDTFYNALKEGARSTTAQARVVDCVDTFRRNYERGRSTIFVTISSGLSGTYDAALAARDELHAQHPDADIHVVDSLSVSAGQALLVLAMSDLLDAGKSPEEVVAWAEHNRMRVHHLVTVDSFEYLVRGGRVSPSAAVAGSVLNIKPILEMSRQGRLIPTRKLRGRQRTLRVIAEMTADRIEDPGGQTIIVNHAQCPQDSYTLQDLLAERLPLNSMMTNRIGVIIGTHTGPSGLVVSFWGNPRAN